MSAEKIPAEIMAEAHKAVGELMAHPSEAMAPIIARSLLARDTAAESRLSEMEKEAERLRQALTRAEIALEPFAEVGRMMVLAGATADDEIEMSGEELRPALIAAAQVKREIETARRLVEGGGK